jgi:hypothetical protein
MTEMSEARPPEANILGYLLPLSILATLFCCLPVGIIAIIFSAQVRSRLQGVTTRMPPWRQGAPTSTLSSPWWSASYFI